MDFSCSLHLKVGDDSDSLEYSITLLDVVTTVFIINIVKFYADYGLTS